jgi:hypothetical protein
LACHLPTPYLGHEPKVRVATKLYIGHNIDPYKWFKQHMHRPPKKMKHDIDMNKTIDLTFKLDILYSDNINTRLIEWKTITFNILIVCLVHVIITLK